MRIEDQILDRIAIIEARTILGDGIYDLINQYIADTRAMLTDIEISRSAGTYNDILQAMIRLKTVSAYVGARKVMLCAIELEKILSRDMHKICLETEEKIDCYLALIRESFDHYQKQVMSI